MNTVDCIRKFGWEWARKNYFFIEEHKHIASSIDFIYQNQLKRYVDAYDLVQSYGGISKANLIMCNAYIDSNHSIPDGHIELSEAITLVEEVCGE